MYSLFKRVLSDFFALCGFCYPYEPYKFCLIRFVGECLFSASRLRCTLSYHDSFLRFISNYPGVGKGISCVCDGDLLLSSDLIVWSRAEY